MKKITKKYKKTLLNPIHKGLQNGMSEKELAKKFSISEEMVSEINYSYKEKKICHKKYTAYKAHIEKKKGTPYDSKIGGTPYLSEGKTWIKCSNCKTELVLALQLNIQELPEIPKGLENWDFVQIFTCMKPHDTKKEALNCFQLGGYYSNGEEASLFNNSFQIELVKKEKNAQLFSYPLWLENYSLRYREEEQKAISLKYNDKNSYEWVDSHCSKEKVITSWSKMEVECDDQYNFHRGHIFYDGEGEVEKPFYACTTEDYGTFDLLGIISDNELENRASRLGENPKCLECGEYMTLLYQFTMFHDPFSNSPSFDGEFDINSSDDWHRHVNTYALYYCEKHSELMSCNWVGVEK